MLTYAGVCWLMLTYAHVCYRCVVFADLEAVLMRVVMPKSRALLVKLLLRLLRVPIHPQVHVCSRMLSYAYGCSRMLTYGSVC